MERERQEGGGGTTRGAMLLVRLFQYAFHTAMPSRASETRANASLVPPDNGLVPPLTSRCLLSSHCQPLVRRPERAGAGQRHRCVPAPQCTADFAGGASTAYHSTNSRSASTSLVLSGTCAWPARFRTCTPLCVCAGPTCGVALFGRTRRK